MNQAEVIREATALAFEEGDSMARRLKASPSEPVLQKVIAFYRRMDARAALATAPVACGEGCAYCCYYHVSVTGAEAIALAEYVDGLPELRRTELRNKVEETATRVAPISQVEYVRTNIPCAFLDGGRCSVYPARPTACRGFHSRDVDVCKRAFDDPFDDEPNPYEPRSEAVKIGFRNAILAAQQRAGFDATSYEMHGAVNEVLKKRSVVKRWRSGKLAFPSVKDRTSIEEATGQ